MSALRAVLFDIDDTLFSTSAFASRARDNAVHAMVEAGLRLPPERVRRELDEVITEFSSNYDHHFDKLLQRLRPSSIGRVNPALIVAAGVAAYHDTKFRELAPWPDVQPLLQGIVAGGLRAGVITHGWTVKQAEKLVRLGLVPLFDPGAIFISDQIGIAKPNPKLYQAALVELGLEPQQVLYVGDNPAHDIAPPASLGIRTAWARRGARVKELPAGIVPDHIVDDFSQLLDVLVASYGLTRP